MSPTDLKNRHPAIPLPAGACTAGDWIDVGGDSPLRYFECRRRIIARRDPDDELTGRRAWPQLRQMVLRARCSWCRFEMRCAIPQVVPHCGGRYDVGTQSNNAQSAKVLQRKSTRRKIIA